MPKTRVKKRSDNFGRLVVFVILYAFWTAFSAHFDPFHLSLGFLCSALVAYFSHDLLIRDINREYKLKKTKRFIIYLPWLIYQIILANIHVAYLVLNPKKIHPQMIKFKTKLKNDFSMVTFGNSITLTPGTITVDIEDGNFYVHALSKKVADDLLSGDMEDRVAHVFLEDENG